MNNKFIKSCIDIYATTDITTVKNFVKPLHCYLDFTMSSGYPRCADRLKIKIVRRKYQNIKNF